jgi:sugar lactone lactonase YvrE
MHGWLNGFNGASVALTALTLCSCLHNALAYGELNKFLIVSSSVTHDVAYAPVTRDSKPKVVKLRQLISDGLTFPQGLAVDQWRRYLYVADPTLKKLVYYVLDASGADRLDVGKQQVAADGVEVRWVSCDSMGNVYFTEESTQRIMRITSTMLDSGTILPEVVFQGTKSPSVNAPGGIAMDNYFVYWVNKLDPTKAGTLIKAQHAPNSTTKDMTKLDVKSYGVCLAANNIFFTTEQKNLYGVPRLGGVSPVAISSEFGEARGCAYDGTNTVYVADKKKNAVYSFPAQMHTLRESLPIQVAAYMQGAYGVAVYTVSDSGDAYGVGVGVLPAFLLAVAFSSWL